MRVNFYVSAPLTHSSCLAWLGNGNGWRKDGDEMIKESDEKNSASLERERECVCPWVSFRVFFGITFFIL